METGTARESLITRFKMGDHVSPKSGLNMLSDLPSTGGNPLETSLLSGPAAMHCPNRIGDASTGTYDRAVRSTLWRSSLARLHALTAGGCDIRIALIDGPIAPHECLTGARIVRLTPSCDFDATSDAARHATFIASMLVGRGPAALGVCSKCTILSIAAVDTAMINGSTPLAVAAKRLSAAVMQAIGEGALVI